MISRCIALRLQPSRDELGRPASRAARDGWAVRPAGRSRWRSRPGRVPKWYCQSRLTITRASAGCRAGSASGPAPCGGRSSWPPPAAGSIRRRRRVEQGQEAGLDRLLVPVAGDRSSAGRSARRRRRSGPSAGARA